MEDTYYNTPKSVQEYIRLSDGIDGSHLIDKLRPYLSSSSSILELGSGPGKDWEILNETYNITGSDLSEEFIKHLKSRYPKGNFIDLDAITIKTDLMFDVIYTNKVLHHLNDKELNQSVKKQSEILNDDGIICHSFWKGEGSEVFNGLFINYHNEASLRSQFKKYFEIVLMERYQEFEEDDSFLLIAKKR